MRHLILAKPTAITPKLLLHYFIVTALLLASSIGAFAQTSYSVESVPDPKTRGQEYYISDPSNYISDPDTRMINAVCQKIYNENNAEVAVVVLPSIGSYDKEEFATSLFNSWGIGSSYNDNGLLILLVMDKRTVTFRTGYGTETILPDAATFKIQQEYMVPKFKEGNYGSGIFAGLEQVKKAYDGGEIEYVSESGDEGLYVGEAIKENGPYNRTPVWLEFLIWYLIVMALPLLLFGILLLAAKLNGDEYKKYNLMKLFTLLIWPILFPLPFIFIRMLTKRLMENWRNTVRISPKTGMPMHKLSEEEEDKYLKAGQISEERVKSVDYDVWIDDTGEEIIILAYKKWFSGFSKCPKCRYKTWQKEYDRTIVPATRYSSGRGEKKHSCSHCHHSKITTYTIPRIQPKNTSSSGGSFGGSSGGGGSWGGGSSGGGGSSSSW